MKRLIIILLVSGIIQTSEEKPQLSLAQRRMLTVGLVLLPATSFKDPQENRFGHENIPSPSRRQRGRDVASLSQKILGCKTDSEFKSLCSEVAEFCNKYREYVDRVDFVEVDGPVLTGKDVLNNSLISILRQIAQNRHWSLLLIPDLEDITTFDMRTESRQSSLVGHDSKMSYDARFTRLPRSDSWSSPRLKSRRSSRNGDDLPLPLSRENELGDRAIKWTDVESDVESKGSDS